MIHFDIDKTLEASIDLRIFKQILHNLLKNALYYIKKSGKGEIYITAKNCYIQDNGWQLIFKDTGPGIKPEDLDHIFELFYSSSETGNGIGLAFCKLAIERMRGAINCRSVYDTFTEFVIKLPKEPEQL